MPILRYAPDSQHASTKAPFDDGWVSKTPALPLVSCAYLRCKLVMSLRTTGLPVGPNLDMASIARVTLIKAAVHVHTLFPTPNIMWETRLRPRW